MTAISNRIHIPAGLAIVCLGFFWGSAFPAIETLVTQIPPLGAAGIRFILSGLIILVYASTRYDSIVPETPREFVGISIVGGFMFGGYQSGLYLGTLYVSGAVAAVVTTMSPVVAALIAVPVLGESRGIVDVTGFVLGLLGVIVLAEPTGGAGSLSMTAIGVGLVFTGTVLFAFGSVLVQLFDRETPIELFQGWAMIVGSLLLFGAGVLRGETVPAVDAIPPMAIVSLLYLISVAGAGGYLLFFRLLRSVGATETTLVAYIEPVAATLVSVVLLEQTLGVTTVGGFLAVATGFTLVSRNTMRRMIVEYRTAGSNPAGPTRNRDD